MHVGRCVTKTPEGGRPPSRTTEELTLLASFTSLFGGCVVLVSTVLLILVLLLLCTCTAAVVYSCCKEQLRRYSFFRTYRGSRCDAYIAHIIPAILRAYDGRRRCYRLLLCQPGVIGSRSYMLDFVYFVHNCCCTWFYTTLYRNIITDWFNNWCKDGSYIMGQSGIYLSRRLMFWCTVLYVYCSTGPGTW